MARLLLRPQHLVEKALRLRCASGFDPAGPNAKIAVALAHDKAPEAAFQARAYGSVEILQKNPASCPRPTGMHAKTRAFARGLQRFGHALLSRRPVVGFL